MIGDFVPSEVRESNTPLIVGFDPMFDEMTVAKAMKDRLYVVNEFHGKEARMLYEKLNGGDSLYEDDLK